MPNLYEQHISKINYARLIRHHEILIVLDDLANLKDGCYLDPEESIHFVRDGKLHREDGPAFIGKFSIAWWRNGKCHREGGPAIERENGHKAWWTNDKLHREDGPAIIHENGEIEWWFDNDPYLDMNKWAKAAGIYDTDEFVMLKLKYHG